MALDGPGTGRRRRHDPADAGVGVDESPVRTDHGEMDLGRAGPQQQQIACLQTAADFVEACVRRAIELPPEVSLAYGVVSDRWDRQANSAKRSRHQAGAIEAGSRIASAEPEANPDEAFGCRGESRSHFAHDEVR